MMQKKTLDIVGQKVACYESQYPNFLARRSVRLLPMQGMTPHREQPERFNRLLVAFATETCWK